MYRRGSSPRLLVHDTALMVVASGESRSRLLEDADRRGHLVETAGGAYLLARSAHEGFTVNWWRDGASEVDFVVTQGRKRTGIDAVARFFPFGCGTQVIYLTGYAEYCSRAYRTEHVWYLLKPADQHDLDDALSRAIGNLERIRSRAIAVQSCGQTVSIVPAVTYNFLRTLTAE